MNQARNANGYQGMPRVSVVTPSYNQAQFLEETIRSVLSQDYPNLEYIIIDGGSTDGSVEIIRRYEDRLAYWVSEPDRGQSHAINKGWRRATGDIVAYLNSDDLYTPGAVTTAVTALLSNPSVCLVHSDTVCIDQHGNVLRTPRVLPFDVRQLIWVNRFVPQPTVFLRRHVLDGVGFLDERLHLVMDYDLWVRIGLQYPDPAIHLRDVCLAMMREHATAKSTAAVENFPLERQRVLRAVFSRPDLPRDIRQLRRDAFSYLSFERAELAARANRPDHIRQPLLRAFIESPRHMAARPADFTYLLARSLMPWWRGRSSSSS